MGKNVSNSSKLRRHFETSSRSINPLKRAVVEDLTFASTLASQPPRGKACRGWQDRRAAPVFQGELP